MNTYSLLLFAFIALLTSAAAASASSFIRLMQLSVSLLVVCDTSTCGSAGSSTRKLVVLAKSLDICEIKKQIPLWEGEGLPQASSSKKTQA